MIESIFCIWSLGAMLVSAYHVGNNDGGNYTSMIEESMDLRKLRGYGNRGGMGMGWGGWGSGGGMMNGGGGGRMEIMQTIHNLFDNRRSIVREVKQTNDGVETYTYSDDQDVTNWIVEHVTQMATLMEGNGGIRLWDDLFEKAFEYRHENHLSFTEVEDGVKVEHKVNDDVDRQERECIVAIIHEHAAVVSEFVKRGMDEAHSNHAVPDECSGM
ncbi:hypothetical protein ACHAW6_015876 [Cyclotella cf. meneghiniana]